MTGAPSHPPPPRPPVIASPRPYQASFGAVWGRANGHADRVVVRIGHRVVGRALVHRRRFSLTVPIPRRDVTLRVYSIGPGGHRSTRVGPVFGLPRTASPKLVHGYKKPSLEHRVLRLTRRFGGVSAAYVENLQTGAGAAWNAAARFPAASTLKLAIAVTLMRSMRGPPHHGSYLDSTMRRMLDESDNAAANTLLGVAGGAWRVNETVRLLGLNSTEMFGGYVIGTVADRSGIPIKTNIQPSFGIGKYTTARDLARLLTQIHLASGGRGAIPKRLHHAVTTAEARYLLYVLAHVHDHGKLDRWAHGGGIAVLHKAGWISEARHDVGLVYYPGGVFIAAVMTWNPAGVGTASDVLAGRIARAGLTVFKRSR